MEKLQFSSQPSRESRSDDALARAGGRPKAISRELLNNAGVYFSIFIVFAVIVIATTDISVSSFSDMAALGLDFFLLLFLSESMYINCSDSGMRHGQLTQIYIDAQERYEQIKKKATDIKYYPHLYTFCSKYVEDELRAARTFILQSVGISYEEYEAQYLGKSESHVRSSWGPSGPQKTAIVKANAMVSAELTPEMLLRKGKGYKRQSPLGMRPETKKNLNFFFKFVEKFVITLGISVIVLDVVAEPSWVLFASVCMKLISVALSGFGGYKFGYDNIVIDTVEFMNDQSYLLEQAVQFADNLPPEAEKNKEPLPAARPAPNKKRKPYEIDYPEEGDYV
jgi:hypothetical protein